MKNKQVRRPASCFLADGLESCTASLEPALGENVAFLAVSCGLALASKSLSQSDIVWDPGSQNMSQVMDIFNNVLWINQFSLGMYTSHWAS